MVAPVAITLDIDGKIIGEPKAEDIASGFEALQKGSGFFKAPGITIAILARDKEHEICATGTRDAGFMLSYKDGDANFEFVAGPEQAVKFGEVVRIFQAYARGEAWGQSNFKWEQMQITGEMSMVTKVVLLVALLGIVAFAVMRFLQK